MPQSVMPALSRALIPEVLPEAMPQLPGVPEFLPASPAAPVLPSRVPADLPAEGREALAAALAGPLPGAQRKAPGKTVLPDDSTPLAWDDAGMARFCGFLRSMSDQRDHRGRRIPLDYLTAVAVAAARPGTTARRVPRPGRRRPRTGSCTASARPATRPGSPAARTPRRLPGPG